MTKVSQLDEAGALSSGDIMLVSQQSSTVTITATTISAAASDNSYNDSGSGFGSFGVGDQIIVTGFTGNAVNNIFSATVTAATAAKLTIGGADGDVIVDEAAGDSVTITKWASAWEDMTTLTAYFTNGLPSALDELTDVSISAPAHGEALVYDSVTSTWGNDTVAGGGGGSSGVQDIWVPATAMTSRTTNGPSAGSSETATNAIMVESLDFDASTDEAAQIRWRMPKSWNEGTFTCEFVWTAGATGDVVWGCRAVAIANDDPMDSAFGTAQTVTDSVTAADDLMKSAATGAITVAGTPAAGELVIFEFYRDADNGSDTLAVDALLLGVNLRITTDADNDA